MKFRFVPAAVAVAVLIFAGCSREEELPSPPVAKCVEAAISQIVNLTVPRGARGVVLRELDVSRMTAADFRKTLCGIEADTLTVWVPGESRWLLVGWRGTNQVSLAEAMDAYAVDEESSASLADVFASYVGTREDVMPAFENELEGTLLPEWFVTREIPKIGWLSTDGVDADILKATLAEIRSVQVVRRLVLEGNIAVRKAKDKKDEEAVTDRWARAMKRNPRDSLLLERLDRLSRNAKGFLEVGKVLQAMKCYETIVVIHPEDAAAVNNFGVCLKRIGKLDLAEKVLKHAKEISTRN